MFISSVVLVAAVINRPLTSMLILNQLLHCKFHAGKFNLVLISVFPHFT